MGDPTDPGEDILSERDGIRFIPASGNEITDSDVRDLLEELRNR